MIIFMRWPTLAASRRQSWLAIESILDVHHELGVLLRDQLGLPTRHGLAPGMQVLALGGLSESGKSTAGAYLATSMGMPA